MVVCVFLEYEWAWVCNIREVKIGHLMYYCIFARTKNLANLIAVRRWAFAIPLISWGSNWIAKQWTLNIAYYFCIPNKRSTITKGQKISKAIYGILNFPKKTNDKTKKIDLTVLWYLRSNFFLFVFWEKWRYHNLLSRFTDL